nr:hypothetical protein [Tanacetum cinerariifolium]
MFSHIEAKVSVKLSDVIDIFDKMHKRTLVLDDDDAIRICLLVLLEHGFLGPQLSHILEMLYINTMCIMMPSIWILKAIPATHRYVHKQPTEKIPRALAWESIQPFTWSRCCTLFVGNQLAPPLETLTRTEGESETDWWKASLEYFEGKHVQSEVVSEQLEIEKDGINVKKRKRGSSQSSLQYPTYDRLMTTVTKLEGTVATLTKTFSSLHGTIVIWNKEQKRLLIADTQRKQMGDERDFAVVSDGDIQAYMSSGLSYTSPASIAQKSLSLANRRKLRVRRTPLKLKSPMRCYSSKMRCTIPPPASTTMPSDTLYPGGKKAEYLEEGKHDGLHINAFIKLMMRKRPRNAQWTLGLSELVAFHIDSRKLMSMVSVVDVLRATIDGTNPSLESLENYEKIIDLLKIWKDFIKIDLENMDWFKNTKRDPKCFKILLRYMNDMPKQSFVYGTLDCGVMTCVSDLCRTIS